ncbi:flocculation-associated PEP-CTERM protein PepA [Pseudoduganella violaceinigra]|uniref:flocculation-associated PEP-CTERM protein PepA n=1 Tax=Pseudoduganella violaceinigra TaxID=246602 RepID=UPI0012B5C4EA|nr:flocculation-associated PEP-CTERM protein PepA [Pseudoduganella violaceinigra]
MKTLPTLGATATLMLVLANANASPAFMVNPNGNGGILTNSGQAFHATAINGISSHRIALTGAAPLAAGAGATYISRGYAYFDSFSDNGMPVSAAHSRANLDYGLYAAFQTTFHCGSLLGRGVSCQITHFNLDMFADPGNDNQYHAATLASDGWIDTVGQQYKLAYSSDAIRRGLGGLNDLGGAFVNLNFGWSLTDEGKAYFVDPVPFYAAAFSAFNNTTQGIQCDTANCADARVVAISSISGIQDFNGVIEPGSIFLLGLGLLAMRSMRRTNY